MGPRISKLRCLEPQKEGIRRLFNDREARSPTMWAAKSGHEQVVLLLEKFALQKWDNYFSSQSMSTTTRF
jgi:hypothetical protein